MANRTIENNADQFMPEYWPANKLIGILENVLIEAVNIIGLIQSGQIANLEAGKITGLLTSEQIKEIEAAKIAGQLTSEQIKSLEAAKISGKIVAEQIESVKAGQIIGQLKSGQIESVEAAKVTGQLTNEQLKEIAAAKIAGQISNAQIAAEAVTTEKLAAFAVTAAKIAAESVVAEKIAAGAISAAKIAAGAVVAEKIGANAVTTEKLAASSVIAEKIAVEAITAEKIAANAVTAVKILASAVTAEKIAAGAISTAKLAAGAVTAEKLSVATLSAITANLGTVTAGKLTAVEIESLKSLIMVEKSVAESENSIQWKASGVLTERVIGTKSGTKRHILWLQAIGNNGGQEATLRIEGENEAPNAGAIKAKVEGKAPEVVIIDGENRSDYFRSVAGSANRKINWGFSTVLFPSAGNTLSEGRVINHGMPNQPIVFTTAAYGPGYALPMVLDVYSITSTQFAVQGVTSGGGVPAPVEIGFYWIAFT